MENSEVSEGESASRFNSKQAVELYLWKLEIQTCFLLALPLKRNGRPKIKIVMVLRTKIAQILFHFTCFPNYYRSNFYDLFFLTSRYLGEILWQSLV